MPGLTKDVKEVLIEMLLDFWSDTDIQFNTLIDRNFLLTRSIHEEVHRHVVFNLEDLIDSDFENIVRVIRLFYLRYEDTHIRNFSIYWFTKKIFLTLTLPFLLNVRETCYLYD